jgi:hypothetical protein
MTIFYLWIGKFYSSYKLQNARLIIAAIHQNEDRSALVENHATTNWLTMMAAVEAEASSAAEKLGATTSWRQTTMSTLWVGHATIDQYWWRKMVVVATLLAAKKVALAVETLAAAAAEVAPWLKHIRCWPLVQPILG